jgi:pyridoxal phosphate enzyme (YggS family)
VQPVRLVLVRAVRGVPVSDVAARLARVRERLGEAALRAGRRPEDVRLVAVSKTFPIEAVREAYDAGQREFGENKVQEALQKIDAGADMQIGWHLIGHLQSNKARKAAAGVGWIHAIDSVDLLRRVDEAARSAGRVVRVLVQVDLALEPTKHGVPVDQVPAVLAAASGLEGARLAGLMLLPPLTDNVEDARPWFRQLRTLRDRYVQDGTPPGQLGELSMGMSHDFEVAIEEGATMVRVGSAIFGTRLYAPRGQ